MDITPAAELLAEPSDGWWELRSAAIGGVVGAFLAFLLDRLSNWLTTRRVRWVTFDRFPAEGGYVSSLTNVGDADAFEVRVEGVDCQARLINVNPRESESRGDGVGPTSPIVARAASGAILGVQAHGDGADALHVRVTWRNGATRWKWLAYKKQIVSISGDSGTESPRV